MKSIIQQTEEFVKHHLANAEAGHNWDHIRRVRGIALDIASTIPNADAGIVEIAALLHDISDAKFNGGDETKGEIMAGEFLENKPLSSSDKEKIKNIMRYVSFKGGKNICPEPFIELHIVQDADRLDAIGAIGIARTFHYGGYKNRAMYDPEIPPQLNMTAEEYRKSKAPTINHFYEKLLLLKDQMHTARGKELAQMRHEFMESFLEHFLNEWNLIL
ncbi:MAG: phosphohydrolase [Marinilabiliales bacterium]|nr:MAG: phosphohydrolase [Marinilabiliales bacterium]